MKRLKFEKLWLLSTQEKRAKVIEIDPEVTSVVGDNEFGKSSLVKSLYAALGADPSKTPESWKNAKVTLLLRFSIGGEVHFILRQGGFFSFFDKDRRLLWVANSVVSDLGPKLAEYFDFGVLLKQKGGGSIVPPPAFCFLPFYIDQDRGWTETWASFSGLGMITRYKDEIAEYHTGIKPREYYLAKVKKDKATSERNELSAEKASLLRAKKRFTDKREKLGIGLDVETFRDRIEALLREQNSLQSIYDELRARASEIQSMRAMAQEEVDVAERVLAELDADIAFATKEMDEEIVCPVCSTVHENDFANRFGLANDADACRTVLLESRDKVRRYDAQIFETLRNVPNLEAKIAAISEILEESRGEIKLADMLKDESERLVDRSFDDEEIEIDAEIGRRNQEIIEASSEMKTYTEPSRKKKIVSFYDDKLRAFCRELNITDIPSSIWGKVRPSISETGSLNPRLFLAYYYSVLHTINEFSTSCFGPIVIDTPLQQDPDPENAKRLIKFAHERRPAGSQLILATGSLHGVKMPGRLIQPSTFRSLLSEDDYEEVHDFAMPFVNESLGGAASEN